MRRKAEIRALIVMLAALVAGCNGAYTGGDASGVISEWGGRGVMDGAFVKARVMDLLPDGRVCIIDRSGRVQLFTRRGAFAGKFKLASVGNGFPTGMDVDAKGRLWIAETHAFRVGVYSPEGEEIFAFGGNGAEDGQFIYASDVEVNPLGKVYVCDYGGADRVQEFDMEGRFVRVLATRGSEPGQFRRPQAMASSADGSLFVADSVNHRIQRFDPDGRLSGVFGTAGSGPGELLYPYDLAISGTVVYIAEYGNSRVQRMTTGGVFEGTWGRGLLSGPWGIATDGESLLVLDTGNSRVLELDPAAIEWTCGTGKLRDG